MMPRRTVNLADPVDPKDIHNWYHGSPVRLTILREGSTVTPSRTLAEVFSHKPSIVGIQDDGSINHNGKQRGFLYEVVGADQSNVMLHPRSAMDPGLEWLTTRPLAVQLIGEVAAEDS